MCQRASRLPRENRRVPGSAESAAAREARARLAARRREVLAALRLAESVAGYAAGQVADGLGPVEARQVAVEAMRELAGVAAALARLTELAPGERRGLAVELRGVGLSAREVAALLAVAPGTARAYRRAGNGR